MRVCGDWSDLVSVLGGRWLLSRDSSPVRLIFEPKNCSLGMETGNQSPFLVKSVVCSFKAALNVSQI